MYCEKIKRECAFHYYCNGQKVENAKNYFSDNANTKNSIDELLYEYGMRDIILYEHVNIKELNSFIDGLQLKRPYFVGVYSILEKESCNDIYLKDGYVKVVVGSDKMILRKFLNYDTGTDYRLINMGTGKLLGYPDCCIKNAVKNSENTQSMVKFEDNNTKIQKKCPLIFNLNRLYSHFPCSDECADTIELAEKMLLKIRDIEGVGVVEDYFSRNQI